MERSGRDWCRPFVDCLPLSPPVTKIPFRPARRNNSSPVAIVYQLWLPPSHNYIGVDVGFCGCDRLNPIWMKDGARLTTTLTGRRSTAGDGMKIWRRVQCQQCQKCQQGQLKGGRSNSPTKSLVKCKHHPCVDTFY